MSDETYDVVLFGATGFTGRQTARYFAEHAPAKLRWAIAGRNASKLDDIAAQTEPTGVIVADSTDESSIEAMVRRARVLLTTAGPFAKYGTPVVGACAEHGVDYVDITGETPWVRQLIDDYHDQAMQTGARIVPFCGFDSVPSDLGTLLAVDYMRKHGQGTEQVSASFTMKGGLNGGTLDSALTMAEEGNLRQLGDVLLLNPAAHRTSAERERSADLRSVVRDEDRDVWLAPFVMAPVNTRVVRRSNALEIDYSDDGAGYGGAFTYHEAMETRRKSKAYVTLGVTAAFDNLVRKSWARTMLRRFGPPPGGGPSESKMNSGFFRTRLVATGEAGMRVMFTLSSDGDPGNRVTVTSLCESALLLATDRDALPGDAERGGVLTPATALGLPLLDRLRVAGWKTEVAEL